MRSRRPPPDLRRCLLEWQPVSLENGMDQKMTVRPVRAVARLRRVTLALASAMALAAPAARAQGAAANSPSAPPAVAGFTYVKSPNLGPKSPGILGKRERLGIMTSPELLPKKGEKRKKEHGRAMSESSANGDGSMSSTSGHAVTGRADENDDLYLAGVQGALPGWGAGWGVQMGDSNPRRSPGRVESIMLNDVGKLINK